MQDQEFKRFTTLVQRGMISQDVRTKHEVEMAAKEIIKEVRFYAILHAMLIPVLFTTLFIISHIFGG